jgi:hypothetical protein
MKESTKALYDRVLDKIDVRNIYDLQDHDTIIDRIHGLSSDSYKLMAYRAIHCIVDDPIYNLEYKKLVRTATNKNNNKLAMSLEELLNITIDEPNALKKLVVSFMIYMNTHYPLRLDYCNVKINPTEPETNYCTYKDGILTFYLNDYKNVSSFGSVERVYDDVVIRDYIKALTDHFGHEPEYLLYHYYCGDLVPFSSRCMYGGHLSDMIYKYTGVHISMNGIRKIHESALIQSPLYCKMSQSEKKARHGLLLHSFATANESYNVV